MSKITVTTKRVYGVLRMYPACKLSQAITSIKMAPTLTNKDVESLIDAGLEVEIRDSDSPTHPADSKFNDEHVNNIAKASYCLANAMLAEREKHD